MPTGHYPLAQSYSIVGPGTERSIIEIGKKSLVGEARARPDLANLGIEKARTIVARLPVLDASNREFDGNQIIQEADCGLAVPSDDGTAIAAAIRELYQNWNKLAAWIANSQAHVDAHFDKVSLVAE